MNIVGVDASGRTGSVCVSMGGGIAFEKTIDEGLTHSQTLLPLADEALVCTGLGAMDVDVWAVTAGPGSFTGLRIGLSLVKGLALPAGAQIAPVSTLEAHAAGSGLTGSVVVALDARRNEVYWAAFTCDEKGCHRLTEDAAEPAANLQRTLEGLPGPIWIIGDGAGLCYTIYKEAFSGLERPEAPGNVALGAVKLVLAGVALPQPAEAVRPCYLRLSQAERERAARLGGG